MGKDGTQKESGKKAKALPDPSRLSLDPRHYYRQVLEGWYDFPFLLKPGVVRHAHFYIPESSRYAQPTVFLLVPAGLDAFAFLEKTGWIEESRKNHLSLVVADLEDGEGKESGAAYLAKLRRYVAYRPFFCAFASSFYAVAYGPDTSDLLLFHSVRNPQSWAGIALLGTRGMPEDLAREGKTMESRVPGVKLSEVPMPLYASGDASSPDFHRLVAYYRAADHSAFLSRVTDAGTEVYSPRRGGTLDDPWCASLAAAGDSRAFASADVLWHFFQGTYRYPGSLNGSLRHASPISRRGFRRFEALVPGGWRNDSSDLYSREWYVYAPASAETEETPVLFLFHGAGGTGEEIADRTGWASVASEKGFILVCPTGSLPDKVREVDGMVTSEIFRPQWNTGDAAENRPSDLAFVRWLYGWVCDHYRVDRRRVYASGQSSGGMMTWACAEYLGDIFAAAAPFSAQGNPIKSSHYGMATRPVVPIFATMGEEDGIFPGGWGTADAEKTVRYWTARNRTRESWDSYTYMDGGKKCSLRYDGITSYFFRNAQGVTVLRLAEAAGKAHAVWPSECFTVWDEWFSRFRKDRNGEPEFLG